MKKKSTQSEIFEALLKPHMITLYQTAYRLLGRREAAEDLVQEVLVKLYPKTAELQTVDALGPWLKKVAYRHFIDELRKRSRRPEGCLVDMNGEVDALKSSEDDPEQMVSSLEIREKLQKALNMLDGGHRAVVIMHLVEGYSLPETAEIYQIPLETVKTRLRRAKVRLKKYLNM